MSHILSKNVPCLSHTYSTLSSVWSTLSMLLKEIRNEHGMELKYRVHQKKTSLHLLHICEESNEDVKPKFSGDVLNEMEMIPTKYKNQIIFSSFLAKFWSRAFDLAAQHEMYRNFPNFIYLPSRFSHLEENQSSSELKWALFWKKNALPTICKSYQRD